MIVGLIALSHLSESTPIWSRRTVVSIQLCQNIWVRNLSWIFREESDDWDQERKQDMDSILLDGWDSPRHDKIEKLDICSWFSFVNTRFHVFKTENPLSGLFFNTDRRNRSPPIRSQNWRAIGECQSLVSSNKLLRLLFQLNAEYQVICEINLMASGSHLCGLFGGDNNSHLKKSGSWAVRSQCWSFFSSQSQVHWKGAVIRLLAFNIYLILRGSCCAPFGNANFLHEVHEHFSISMTRNFFRCRIDHVANSSFVWYCLPQSKIVQNEDVSEIMMFVPCSVLWSL
jgi:hypothetical protein